MTYCRLKESMPLCFIENFKADSYCQDTIVSKNLTKYNTQSIRILLVDDQVLLLDALTVLLKSSSFQIDVVGRATNGIEAIEKALQLEPDLVLMDLLMPEMSGNDAAYQISKCLPDSKILILSSNNKEKDIADARNSGASGYMLKTIDQNGLNQAIAAVMSNKYDFISPGFNEKAVTKQPHKAQTIQLLTCREKEVIKMLAEGRKNREISELLEISIRTTEKHRANIMKKLGNPTPAELFFIAKKINLAAP